MIRKFLILILGTFLVGSVYTAGNLFAASVLEARLNADVSFAEDTADPADTSSDMTDPASEEDYACGKNMLADGKEFVGEYMNFLDAYFKQDEPSSDQIEIAMEFYRYTEDSLMNIWAKHADLSNAEVGKTLDLAISEYTYCTSIRDNLILESKLLLQAYARYSAESKRTFQVIDGLKAINEKLRVLSGDFSEVFPGKFAKMDSSLKCYAKECITK